MKKGLLQGGYPEPYGHTRLSYILVFYSLLTPRKVKIAPKNSPSQKETHLPIIQFSGAMSCLSSGVGVEQLSHL